MINNNPKKQKKSILAAHRIDVFLIIFILILMISPLIFNLFMKTESGNKQVNLFISERFGELLGAELTEALLQEFNGKNPGIFVHHIKTESAENNSSSPVPSTDAPARFFRQNRNSPVLPPSPDILIFDEGEFSVLAAAGKLAEFYCEFEETTQLAIPLVSFMNMLFYNIEILAAAGFNHPPKTRDEFLAYSRAVSRRNFPGVSGTTLSLNPEDRQALSRDFFSWILASGGNFWPAEDNSPASFNNHISASDITFFGALYREVQAQGISLFETTSEKRIKDFAQGKIAMMIASTSAIPYLREQMGDAAFGVTTIPVSGTGGKYNISLSSIYAGISSETETLMRFLEFLEERSVLFCTELKAVPGLVSNLIPGDYVRDDPFYLKAWDIFEASRIVEGFSGKPNAEEYETVFMEELQNFFEGKQTAAQTAAVIQRRWDEIYNEYE